MTKSISSSTRPSSAGSQSAYDVTRDRICRQARAMSAWSACGQPSASQIPCFHSTSRGTSGHAREAEPLRLHRRPRRRRRGGRRPARARRRGSGVRRRRCGSPWSRGPGGRRARRRGAPGRARSRAAGRPGRRRRRGARRRRPRRRRSSPQTFSTSSASCRPSTKIRLSRATRARRAGAPRPIPTPYDAASPGAGRVTGAVSTTGRPSSRKPGTEREGAAACRAGPRG